jgi:diguanylate cyclase (GGDEF)-like protein/PAS domain S-box-containing protein
MAQWYDDNRAFLDDFDRMLGQAIAANVRQAGRLAADSGAVFRAIFFVGVAFIGLVLFGVGAAAFSMLRDRDEAMGEAQYHLWMADRIFESTHNSVIMFDGQGLITRVNPAFTRLSGYSAADVAGRPLSGLNSGRQPDHFYREMRQALREKGSWTGELWNRAKDGSLYMEAVTIFGVGDPGAGFSHFVAVGADVTQRHFIEGELGYLAMRDVLTGLPNRVHFNERLGHAVARAQRTAQRVSVMVIDLDEFEKINETLGHGIGDEVLKLVARRLQRGLRASDGVARLGGDEFAIVLEDIHEPDEVARIARSLLGALDKAIRLNGQQVTVTASIGVSLYPDHGLEPKQLIDRANKAMYEAKAGGKNQFRFFDTPQDIHAEVPAA